MTQPNLTLAYHSRKMLLTLDLNSTVRVLLEAFGPDITFRLRPMTDAERDASEKRTEHITAVQTRLMVKELRLDGVETRHEALEQRIVDEGQK